MKEREAMLLLCFLEVPLAAKLYEKCYTNKVFIDLID